MGRLFPFLAWLFGAAFAILVVGPLGSLVYDRAYKTTSAVRILQFVSNNWFWVLPSVLGLAALTLWSWLDHRSDSDLVGPAAPGHLHQLPLPPKDFTGREDEVIDLVSALKAGRFVGLVLQGMGGIGKTALCLKVAAQLKRHYRDAQFFIDLRGTGSSPLAATEAMAQVIRSFYPAAKLPVDASEITGFYRSVLSEKRSLLVLDDAADAWQIEPLLAVPGCIVLVTSRRRIVLPGCSSHDVGTLAEDEARALLLSISPRINGHADSLAALCGFVPLALRLTASLLRRRPDLTPVDYIHRLADEQQRLELIGIEASLKLTYDFIEPHVQQRLRELTVFRGGFDSAAAAVIWQLDPDSASKTLSTLLEYNLIEWSTQTSRYRLHDLLHLFVDARLTTTERAIVLEQHALYYPNVLAVAEGLYLKGSKDVTRALDLFDREWANIQAGQQWAEAHSSEQNAAAALCVSYTRNGRTILQLRESTQMRIKWLEAALVASRRLKNREAEGVTLGNLGIAYGALGEFRRSIEFSSQYLEIARELADRLAEGRGLCNLGIAHSQQGHYDESLQLFTTALAIARSISDQHLEAQILNNLSALHSNRRQYQASLVAAEHALTVARQLGDVHAEAMALGNVATALSGTGHVWRVFRFNNRALRLYREIGDRVGEATVLGNLGNAYLALGRTKRAIELLRRQLAIAQEVSDSRSQGFALFNLSDAVYKRGRRLEALQLVQEAVQVLNRVGSPLASRARERSAAWLRAEAAVTGERR